MTAPLSPREAAVVARFDEAPDAAESLRWRIAEALNREGAWCGVCGFESGLECSECRRTLLGYADAAIDVMRGEQS